MNTFSQRSVLGISMTFLIAAFGAFANAENCTVESIKKMATDDTSIVSATLIGSPVPYCNIEGYVTTQNPGPNHVGFLLSLPEKGWNGRFYFNSVGGAAGFLQAPNAQLLVDGFAVATTDAGHRSKSMLDWSDMKDPAKALDIAHRSLHVSAVAAQAITKTFYDANSMYRYVEGCSGGGQRALSTARLHPEDYDGFIIEAPGINAGNILAFASATQFMAKNPDAWIPPSKVMLIEQKVNQACGAVSGVVPNSLACKFDAAALQCAGADAPDCLTSKQVQTAQLITRGPRSPKGQIYPGAPYTNTTGWIGFFTGMTPPPWSETDLTKAPGGYVIAHSFMRGYFGEKFDFVNQFNFNNQKDVDAYLTADRKAQMGQTDADLSALEKAGRKVLFWHGMSDPGIIYSDTIRYYEALKRTLPGDGRIEKFTRLFAVPGVLHCGGGSGPTDMGARALDKMVDWVEKDIAPEAVVANRTVEPFAQVRQFLICAYPKVAVFKPLESSKGDPMAALYGKAEFDANNWACE